MKQEAIWLDWMLRALSNKPKNNALLESERGREITKIAFEEEKIAFNWRRSDCDTFWIDVQMFIYYGFSDNNVRFVIRYQPGIWHYEAYAEERKAYAEMMRGLNKLRKIQFPDIFKPGTPQKMQEKRFDELDFRSVVERVEKDIYGGAIPWGCINNTIDDLEPEDGE